MITRYTPINISMTFRILRKWEISFPSVIVVVWCRNDAMLQRKLMTHTTPQLACNNKLGSRPEQDDEILFTQVVDIDT